MVLFGDPAKTGFYSILLFVPMHTTIQAHSHRDDRMATVVSGEWRFGYGTDFDEKLLKRLPPGSVYSEPGGADHFAQTADDPVIVHICGYGPTDTRYFDPMNDPLREKIMISFRPALRLPPEEHCILTGVGVRYRAAGNSKWRSRLA